MSFEFQPVLSGELVLLRPLLASDFDDLYDVAKDPLLWQQHPAKDRYKQDVFQKFFDEAIQSGGALVAVDSASGNIIGTSRYHDFDPHRSSVEIGWSFLARLC